MLNSSPFKRITRQGLTYDDVLLVPAHSTTLPRDVDTSVRLTPTLKLNIPVISAAMDTVSEYRLAIALAREGGIAMLHKNMSIEDQAEQVRLVKRSESGMIVDPVTLSAESTVKEARALMKKHKIERSSTAHRPASGWPPPSHGASSRSNAPGLADPAYR